MVIKENPEYGLIKIYSSIKKDEEIGINSEELKVESPKLFLARGKPDFSDLNFTKYRWKRINNLTPEAKNFIKSTSGYKDYKETIIYQGPQGMAVVHANKKKDNHKIAIYVENSEEDPLRVQAVKNMFELEWGLKLEEVDSLHLKESSELEKKIKQN